MVNNTKKWRLISSGLSSAAWNMAVDEALMRSFSENDMPLLRLYEWENPSLSLGRFSHPEQSLDPEKMEKSGIEYVRRMTGGGILVHGGDISYTLIVPQNFVRSRGVKSAYRYLCGFIMDFYKRLGLDASFAKEDGPIVQHTESCLAGREAYDIVIDGRKIGGNAQRHTRSAMLQHGSIPLCIDRELFEPLFRIPSGLPEAGSLKPFDINLPRHDILERIKKSFGETYSAELIEQNLSAEVKEFAHKLYNEKYFGKAWNVYARNTL